MNFFHSIFSDDAQSDTESDKESQSKVDADSHPPRPIESPPEVNQNDIAWSFGSLLKTLTIKSESMMETYRRDLKEFGDGIKKEIEVVQGSLGTVGHAIDEIGSSVLKGTAQIISQGTDAILPPPSDESEPESSRRLSSKQYSRLETQISAIQIEPGTYAEEPEDVAEYEKWKATFDLSGKKNEAEELLEGNKEMRTLHSKLVPDEVTDEEFWFKYYFKMNKLVMAEDIRAKIVKRAISLDEEELSWDVDDDEYSGRAAESEEGEEEETEKEEKGEERERDEKAEKEEKGEERERDEEAEKEEKGEERERDEEAGVVVAGESEGKEEEIGWDEIEDMSGIDDRRKVSSANIADVRKQLEAGDDEDLSWDVEDEG